MQQMDDLSMPNLAHLIRSQFAVISYQSVAFQSKPSSVTILSRL